MKTKFLVHSMGDGNLCFWDSCLYNKNFKNPQISKIEKSRLKIQEDCQPCHNITPINDHPLIASMQFEYNNEEYSELKIAQSIKSIASK